MTAAALGAPVAALVERCGIPDRVISDNRGNHMLFHQDGGIADALVDADGAVVRALAIQGAAAAAAFAATANAASDEVLYSFGNVQVFGFGPNRAEVRGPESIVVGDIPALQRMRAIPGRLNEPDFASGYVAPRLAHGDASDGSGPRATIVRIDIDATGIVRAVTTAIASTDAAFDATLAARFDDDTYTPATLYGHAIGASVYREIRH